MAHAPVDGVIAERARKTLGLVTMSDLHALGVTRQQRRTLVDNGVLVRISATVFRHAAWPPAWRQAVLAAVLSRGAGAVASHMAAAALWGFDGIPPGAIEVTVPHARRPGPGPGRLHRSRALGPADVGDAGGSPSRRRPVPSSTSPLTSGLTTWSASSTPPSGTASCGGPTSDGASRTSGAEEGPGHHR